MGPSIWQILIVLLIVLLLFGTKKLRNVGSDLGEAIKGFKKGLQDGEPGKLEQQTRADAAPESGQKAGSTDKTA